MHLKYFESKPNNVCEAKKAFTKDKDVAGFFSNQNFGSVFFELHQP